MQCSADKGEPQGGIWLLADVSLPAAVVVESALDHNITWMQQFADAHGAQLAPHGKTTMTPALFQRQLDAGAWAITLATASQCRAAVAHGVERVILANQLVGLANMKIIAELLEARKDFYCLVDSTANVSMLGRFFGERGLTLKVLIETGMPNGRAGCRTQAQVLELATAIRHEPALRLAGIEGYEGLVSGTDQVSDVSEYAASLVAHAQALDNNNLFDVAEPVITASGSAWYDLVASAFDSSTLRERFMPVLRPGCYVVHDHGIYQEAQQEILSRRRDLQSGLQPALEVFAQVQSLPEPGLAIAGLGKRDIGSDQMPLPLRRYREGRACAAGRTGPALSVDGWTVRRMMDQHAFIQLPEDATDIKVGDIVAFGTSHPCLTFDKWRKVCLADDEMKVKAVWATYF